MSSLDKNKIETFTINLNLRTNSIEKSKCNGNNEYYKLTNVKLSYYGKSKLF